MKKLAIVLLVAATFVTAPFAVAQAQDMPKVYKLEYTVLETEGAKKISSRTYTLMVEDNKRSNLRVGLRVPIATSLPAGGDGPTQYNYMDVGVQVDALAHSLDASTIRLETISDITSLVTPDGAPSARRPPTTRSCRESINTVIPLDKVVTLSTQDDPSYNTTMTLQVVAHLVKSEK